MTCTVITGDNVFIYRALATRKAIQLYQRAGIIPTRGMTITKLLAIATSITGNKYKRGEYARAADELGDWCDAQS